VQVAIVNWRAAAKALRAATSFQASTGVSATVMIVDNDSSPVEREVLQTGCPPGVTLRLERENLGYGRAANAALADVRTDCVCVCNPDVVPDRDMLKQLTDLVLSQHTVGAAAPQYTTGGSGYHSSLPSGGVLLVRAFAGSFRRPTVPNAHADEVLAVEQPAGACVVLRSDVWREVGGFDPEFFLFYEDVDLAKRLRAAGYRNVVVGSARARHDGAQSVGQMDAVEHQVSRLRSLQRYSRKHHRRLAPLLRVAVIVAALVRGTAIGGPAAGLRLVRSVWHSA
jgi:N-acetylglucosaminyl-diphospho-decaprenol L-rhamnosyltransferase